MTDDLTIFYRETLGRIPQVCRHHFHAIWCDHRLRMLAEPCNAAVIADALVEKARRLANPLMAALPPNLWRLPLESPEQYLDRCYQWAGWTTPVVVRARKAS